MTNKFVLVAANFFAHPEKCLQKFGKSVILAVEAARDAEHYLFRLVQTLAVITTIDKMSILIYIR